ncbi:MAG TPA: M67 family metallopeptidase [Terriglobales bacterium]|jgi:proteasome lid subunit RPN8/RPN11|nr:M67 family metallopeptidase [Terriglobales bacterium]
MLKIAFSDYDALRRHGEESYPHECCGILLGRVEGDSRFVHAVIRCTNAREDAPQTHYEIDPRELIRAQRDARERDLEVVGFYHSHPDHAAVWSRTDLEEAHWIGCSYVITAVENGKAMQTNSFALAGTMEEDKAFAEERLVVEPGNQR